MCCDGEYSEADYLNAFEVSFAKSDIEDAINRIRAGENPLAACDSIERALQLIR